MAWMSTSELNSTLALRPPLATKFTSFMEALGSDGSVSQEILDLCRRQVLWVHGLESNQPDPKTEADRAALVVAEKMPYGHHDISDDNVDSLKEHFGEAGAVNLLTAIAMFDATTRMQLVVGGS